VIVIPYASLAALRTDVARAGKQVHEHATPTTLAGAVIISAAVAFRVTLMILHHVTITVFSTETLYFAARPSATTCS
jgi:hypothetical protein